MSYQVIDPYTEETVATFAEADAAEQEAVLAQADAYYQQALTIAPSARAKQLARLGEVFAAHRDELAATATRNMGKLLREANGEVGGSLGVIKYYAENGPAFLQPDQRHYQGTKLAQVTYAPTGPVLAIEPWNFPYTQVMRVFAPNFILGNPVILKHAPSVAECALLFAKLVKAAGIPDSAFQNLFLTNDQAATVIADPRVQGVALTGSVRAGRQVAAEAGAALTKVTLELGGNDALLVLDDADIEAAADAAVGSRLRNAGQVCVSAKRFIVTQAVAPAFQAALIARFSAVTLGDPRDEKTTVAPLASAAGREKLQAQVETAVAHGATVLVDGGTVTDRTGYFFKPMLLTDITPDNPIFDEELFGPVGQLHVVADDDAAIALANGSQYGLAATVFAGDSDHAAAVATRLAAGQVFINQQAVAQPELPFGGVKNSGFGREMSEQALYEFANHKATAFG